MAPMSKGPKPYYYYYRKSLLSLGLLPLGLTCPFADKCDRECSAKTELVNCDWRCSTASALNRAYRETPPENPQAEDKRGRKWERFCDESYFGLVCIRCMSVEEPRDFNSQMSFHFDKNTDADAFWDMIPRLS